MIITFFAGVIDLKASRFTYSNAGHNHPYLVRGNKAHELPVSGSAIGFADKVSYPEQTVNVMQGDIIVLYTDGLVESGEASEFTPLQLAPVLESIPYGPDYHRRIMESSLAGTSSKVFADDVTVLTCKVL